MRKPCNHISVHDAVGCQKCNPRRLSRRQYAFCLDNGINPRRPNRRALARLVAQEIRFAAARAEREDGESEE